MPAPVLKEDLRKRDSLRSLGAEIWKARTAYLFLLPLFVGLLAFGYYPPIMGIYRSLFYWKVTGAPEFVGLQNYKNLYQDIIFLNSIPVMFKLLVPSLLIGIFVPFIMCELIYNVTNSRLKGAYRVLILLPMITPGVVGTLIWKYIYDPQEGIVTNLFKLFGILKENQVIDWLRDPKYVIGSIIFMGFPWIGGTSVLIYMSGLMNIGIEVFESAKLDGANIMQRIFYIDIPNLAGQFRYFFILGVIGGLQNYGVQVVITKGGPGYTTMVPGYYMYQKAFSDGLMGYASTIGTTLFIVIFIISFFIFKYLKEK